jgi:hypothetical protein
MLFQYFLAFFASFFPAFLFLWFKIKSITSSHSKRWIIQILYTHYTHIFTKQYDDHDDFPIQSKQEECYKFWDTKALYTIYITATHIFNISLRQCLYGFLCNVDIYIYIFVSREMKKKKLHGRSSLHTKLIIFEVSACYIQRSIFAGIWIQEREAYSSITLSSYPIYIWSTISAMSAWSDGIHLCPNKETTL